MNIGKMVIKPFKLLFMNPCRKGAKLYEQLPMAISLGYTGVNSYKAIEMCKQNNDKESKEYLANAYAGIAGTVGSIFGIGGTILLGGGIKLLGNECRKNFA